MILRRLDIGVRRSLRVVLQQQPKRSYTEGNILKLQDRGFFQDVFPAEAM